MGKSRPVHKGRAAGNTGYSEAELDLHARTVEEAIPLVDNFLNEAYLGGLQRVRIIHGKGTGTLKLDVDRFLARNSLVAGRRPADRFHGGDGATEVELSRR
jgi:DNA mismatch repair protein MutS2